MNSPVALFPLQFLIGKLIWLTQVMNLIGDVKGKVAVMVDDMIDTAGELSHLWIPSLANWFHMLFVRSCTLTLWLVTIWWTQEPLPVLRHCYTKRGQKQFMHAAHMLFSGITIFFIAFFLQPLGFHL